MEFRVYSAYGYRVANTVAIARTGYAGAVGEFELPWYLLGLRFYLPWLRRFISPDAASPFGAGGCHRYAYCSGDPINRIDPSGNASFGWLGRLLGHAMGATGNAARTVAQAMPTSALMAISSVAQALSVGTTIAAVMAAQDGAPAAGILGLIAGASGVAGVGLGVAGQPVSKSVRARRRSGMRSDSAVLAKGFAPPTSEVRGHPADPSTGVIKTIFEDPGNRVVVNYKGIGLKKMSALQKRLGPASNGKPFSLVPGSVTWINDHGGEVIGFDSPIGVSHITKMMGRIAAGNEGKYPIRIFAGVHGNGSGLGDNWYRGRYRQDLGASGVIQSIEDSKADMPHASSIVVHDMLSLTDNDFMKMLTEREAINVLGWCYSIADEKASQARMSLGEKEPFHYRTYKHAALA